MHLSTVLALVALLKSAVADVHVADPMNHQCPDSGEPNYPVADKFNTAFIPFKNSFPNLKETPAFGLSITYNQKTYSINSAGMDTGSTGVVVGAGILGLSATSKFDKSKPGQEFLSSSQRLWEGYWLESQVAFFMGEKDANGRSQEVVANIPILAVTKASVCPNFKKNGGKCSESEKFNITMYPKKIQYIGVGFGRWSDEQPEALPEKVPFINIAKIRGQAVEGIHQGYILNKTGIQVGLTKDKTAKFRKTKLTARKPTDNDWEMAPMAIRINNSPFERGKALFDTGINQSYVAVYNEIGSRAKVGASPVTKKGTNFLQPGSVVEVLVPNELNPIANYTVTVTSNPKGMEAAGYVMEGPPTPSSTTGPFINTGRMFYNGFDAMLDSDCGFFGLRKH